MKTYDAKDIRNVLLVGHGGSGKTTLLEAMLYTSGAITRMGTVEDGNTVSDHDPDEQRKNISVSLSMAPNGKVMRPAIAIGITNRLMAIR